MYHFPVLVDAENKEDSIKNVRFSTAIQTGNSVELGIEAGNDGFLGVRLAALKNKFLYFHFSLEIKQWQFFPPIKKN